VPSKKEREREEADKLLDVLADRFPSTFVRDRDRPVRPLAVGTRQALAALLPEEPKWKISRAIGAYIARVQIDYLNALIAGEPRVDLAGTLGAVPTDIEREAAKKQLAAWQEKRRERKRLQEKERRIEQKKRQSDHVGSVGAPEQSQNAGKAPHTGA
jgi:sRNA-binding protein